MRGKKTIEDKLKQQEEFFKNEIDKDLMPYSYQYHLGYIQALMWVLKQTL